MTISLPETENVLERKLRKKEGSSEKEIRTGIFNRVQAIVVDKLGVDENEVTEEASFLNDLGADSLDTVELSMELQREFGCAIEDAAEEKIRTVGDACDQILKAKSDETLKV
ncbi:acyl carrier protein [bacterium]|jgi:acyl carrier protein|nr:acyl carrier protein [bacterium]MBT6831680.1 acyl carrier protein [bacterium]MBT6996326.1 acyl carrier protein [bacterium]MBT7773004.1 acyl carrier protein [bacterium]